MQSQTVDPAKTELNYHHTTAADHHEEHPDHRLFGLFVFLVAEGMIFMGLFGAYLAFRSTLPVWPPEGTPELELLLPSFNTVNLIASSFVMHNADTAIKKNDTRGTQMWLAITAAMGALFLVGQVYFVLQHIGQHIDAGELVAYLIMKIFRCAQPYLVLFFRA